jgi:hypothetical protein
MISLNTLATSLEIGGDLPALPPRFRFRDLGGLLLGGGDFFNDDGER